MNPTSSTNLAAWRAGRISERTLPSGLDVKVKKVTLLDLAAQGSIPTPLLGAVQTLIDQASNTGSLEVTLAGFEQHASVINLVFKASMVEPAVADEPSETHIGVNEAPITDRLDVFNWAQEETAQLATFPQQAQRTQRTPRGRKSVSNAAIIDLRD